MKLLTLLMLVGWLHPSFGGDYLFWIPLSSKSVKIGFMPMAKELAKRGHSVKIVSPYKEKKPIKGIVDINIFSALDELTDSLSDTILEENSSGIDNLPLSSMINGSIEANRAALKHPEVQKILSDERIKVDVMLSVSVLGNEAGYFVAEKKNASLVQWVSSPFLIPWYATGLGAPVNPAYMPIPLLPYTQRMNFKERFINTLATTIILLGRKFYVIPKLESMIAEEFPGESVTDLNDYAYTAALGINWGSPFLADGLRPVLPNVIQGSLMSCVKASPLEGELKKWVDGAKDGVIYVSFGSVVKPSKMPESRRKLMLSVFGKLKERIIWKWDGEMPDAPENIKIFSWLPQMDVLAHPKVKLFVTHGGAGSIQETMCHKTPIVGIPINGDQINNIDQAMLKHIGTSVRWRDLTVDRLEQAVNSVLTDPSYKESVDRIHDLIMDQPQHPLDRAVWWLEYLLRHPKNIDMRSPAHDLNMIQYLLLDIIAVILTALFLVIFIIRKLCSLCCGRKAEKTKKE